MEEYMIAFICYECTCLAWILSS